MACGGDGTIGWVLNSLDLVKQDSACFIPPCGITPLGRLIKISEKISQKIVAGTGNDLARVLRWGSGTGDSESAAEILQDVIEAEEIDLDRWTVVFHQDERPKVEILKISEPNFSGLRFRLVQGNGVLQS